MKETKFWEQLKSGHFAQMVRENTKGREISSPVEAYNIVKPLFSENDDVETMYCIFLDGQNHILAIEKMFSGSLSSASIYPRELIKRVLDLKSAAVLVTHNHPSGNTSPSEADRTITRKMILSLAAIDVLLHDHIIVGDGYHSMSEDGWIRSIADKCQKFLAQHN